MYLAFVAAAAVGSVRGSLVGGSPAGAAPQSTANLPSAVSRIDVAALRPYGEALGGALIALAGVAFWLWPVA